MNVEQRLFDMVSQWEFGPECKTFQLAIPSKYVDQAVKFLEYGYNVKVFDIPDDLHPEDAVIEITRKP